jgi:hypothetical protein
LCSCEVNLKRENIPNYISEYSLLYKGTCLLHCLGLLLWDLTTIPWLINYFRLNRISVEFILSRLETWKILNLPPVFVGQKQWWWISTPQITQCTQVQHKWSCHRKLICIRNANNSMLLTSTPSTTACWKEKLGTPTSLTYVDEGNMHYTVM